MLRPSSERPNQLMVGIDTPMPTASRTVRSERAVHGRRDEGVVRPTAPPGDHRPLPRHASSAGGSARRADEE